MKTLLKTLTAFRFVAAGAAFAFLAGCATATPAGVAGSVQGTNGNLGVIPTAQETSIVGRLDISGPGGYRVMTLTAWNLADIDHVKLTLTKDGAAVATKKIVRADLNKPVTLSNLKMASTYKVVAQAYSDAAATNAIDNTAEAGTDVANSVTFTTPSLVVNANGDTVDSAARTITIPVKLRNKTFAGQANSGAGVAVTNGTIVNTTATESF